MLGTIDHPRIEVVDSSPVPPQRVPAAPEPEDVDDINVTTFGRGLDLVAMMSHRWGSDLGHDRLSKSVWFEPTVEFNEHYPDGEIFVFDLDEVQGVDQVDPRRMKLYLLNVPAGLFGELRRYHFEIRRELRLLAMTAPEDYPLAVAITEQFKQADRERRATQGIEHLDRAVADGVKAVDLEYSIPLSAPATMVQIRDLLEKVYRAFFPREPPGPQAAGRLAAAPVVVLHRVRATGRRGGADALGGPDHAVLDCMTRSSLAAGALAAGLGGSLGALARWALSLAFPVHGHAFPWVTFAINVVGSALLAGLALLPAGRRTHLVVVFLGTGILGGFTTMSAASVETFTLLDEGEPMLGAAYCLGTLALALLAVLVVDRWATPAARAWVEQQGGDE